MEKGVSKHDSTILVVFKRGGSSKVLGLRVQ